MLDGFMNAMQLPWLTSHCLVVLGMYSCSRSFLLPQYGKVSAEAFA